MTWLNALRIDPVPTLLSSDDGPLTYFVRRDFLDKETDPIEILTALDSLSLIGFTADDPDVRKGLDWFTSHQEENGLWDTAYGKGKNADRAKLWVSLAACRVLKRLL
jgi:hypothetical protein